MKKKKKKFDGINCKGYAACIEQYIYAKLK